MKDIKGEHMSCTPRSRDGYDSTPARATHLPSLAPAVSLLSTDNPPFGFHGVYPHDWFAEERHKWLHAVPSLSRVPSLEPVTAELADTSL
jgi:hypothetical protein